MGQLDKALANMSLWEMKSYVRKAQNAVLNLTDVEAKVREATNNEPWGASTTLMADIARATFSYRDREEICNMIFRRFTEKSVREWRQIYKALVLLEYLVKNGSERFVDDARANVALVTMLKSFHYIDSKGVDQGVNVRNRSRELTQLLNDESKIRDERKKAKENAKKFGGVSSNDMAGSSFRGSGGVGGDEYETRVFGDGGVYGQRYEEQRHVGNNAFEEYDLESPSHHQQTTRASHPVTDTSRVNAHASAPPAEEDDDDFDDFQSATPGTTAPAKNGNTDLLDLLDFGGSSAPTTTQSQAPQHQQQQSFYQAPSLAQPVISQAKPKDDIFGDLLSSAKSSKPVASKPFSQPPAQASTQASAGKSSTQSNFDSLLDL